MPSLIERFPLRGEYPETILARLVADQNAGIEPSDPLYAALEPGSVWDDLSRAFALEIDRVYDRMHTEIPAAALPGTATGQWLDAWADNIGLTRKVAAAASGTVRFTGTNGTAVPTGTQVSTEAPTADSDPITFQTTEGGVITGGHVDLLVVAVVAGSEGNVAANSVTLLDSAIDGVTVSNPTAITAGDDDETDERLQIRVLRKLRGTAGAGNADYYINLALNYPGIGFVTVQPNTPALGDVRVIVTDINNDPVSEIVTAGLQAVLDPLPAPAQGQGQATVGAEVTVTTPGTEDLVIAATLVPEAGYSVTGAAGTRALADDVTTAVRRYVDELTPGQDVIYNKVLAAIVDVEGVADVSALTLNGNAANLTVASTDVVVLTSVGLS